MPLWVSGRAGGHQMVKLTAADGLPIPVREWHRADAAAAICYLHGMGEHSGPFAAMGDRLFDQGFSVYAHDQRGFGLSTAPRGDLRRFEDLVEDLEQVVAWARSRKPGRPRFLLGFSMGGHVAARAAARLGEELSGVILLAPGFKLRRIPPRALLQAAVRLLVKPTSPEPWPLAVPVTRSPEHQIRSEQDERWVRRYTPRFYLETWRSIRVAFREAPGIHLPVLVLVPAYDFLVDARAAAAWVRRLGSQDKAFRVVPAMYHQMVVDPDMPRLVTEVGEWIRARIDSPVDTPSSPC